MKYKITLLCYDYGCPVPYEDEVENRFDTYDEAYAAVRQCVLEELQCLNDNEGMTLDDVESDEYIYRADFDGNASAIVRFWDGDDYMTITIYDIEEVQ